MYIVLIEPVAHALAQILRPCCNCQGVQRRFYLSLAVQSIFCMFYLLDWVYLIWDLNISSRQDHIYSKQKDTDK